MQDNALITGCSGGGVEVSGGTFTMMGKATVIGNGVAESQHMVAAKNGGGISMGGYSTGTVTIQDDASVTNNTSTDKGGGIYMERGTLVLKGKAVVSDNKAKQGGGIYFAGGNGLSASNFTGNFWIESRGSNQQKTINMGTMTSLNIQDQAQISGNKADYGAGVYAEKATSAPRMTYNAAKLRPNLGGIDLGPGFSAGAVENVPAFTLAGGSVTGNEAQFVGGGIYAKAKGPTPPARERSAAIQPGTAKGKICIRHRA